MYLYLQTIPAYKDSEVNGYAVSSIAGAQSHVYDQ